MSALVFSDARVVKDGGSDHFAVVTTFGIVSPSSAP